MIVIPDVPAFTLRPDWVCEVLSPEPESTRRDRIAKPDAYAAAGVPHLWIVDPVAGTLEVFRLVEGFYARVHSFVGDVFARAEPFQAAEIDISAWWLPEP